MEIIDLPEEALPTMEELSGDMRTVAEVVGIAKAVELGQHFHGVPIRLWNTQKFLLKWRDKQIVKDFDNGMSGIQLAKKYNLSERQIWNILGRPMVDERQLSLWGGL